MTQPAAGRKRLLPRLNLATLLVLVAVAGISAGWGRSIRAQRQAVRALRNAGAIVVYDWEWRRGAPLLQGNDEELTGWRRLAADRLGPDAVAAVAAVSLREIRGNSGTTDEHIKLVGRLKSLRELRLGKLAITEEGAAPIAGLQQLQILVINDGGTSDLGPILSRFGEDSRLEFIYLRDTTVDDGDLAAISRLPLLQTLLITGGSGEIGDAGMEELAALGRLKHLCLPQTRITAEGLESIGRMKSLESISIDESSIDGMTPFLQLPKLRYLFLGRCRVDDEDLSALGEMPALKHLYVTSDSITDAGLEPLAAIKTLEHINFYDSKITPEQFGEFAKAHPGISRRDRDPPSDSTDMYNLH